MFSSITLLAEIVVMFYNCIENPIELRLAHPVLSAKQVLWISGIFREVVSPELLIPLKVPLIDCPLAKDRALPVTIKL